MDTANPAAGYWLRRARRLALFVNAVWLFERLVPVIVGVNLITCCLLLFLRRHLDWVEPIFYIAAGGVAVTALVMILVRRKRAFGIYDALLRLETALNLDNSLTTAYSDGIPWPQPLNSSSEDTKFYKLHWQRSFFSVAASFAIVLGGLWVPVGVAQSNPMAENPSPPLEISKVEVWIEQLEEADFVDDEALKDLKEAVADLKNRPSDEWFTAGALEAADHLHENTANSIEGLARNMQMVSSVLNGAPSLPENLSQDIYEQIDEAYQKALSEMQNSSLPLSPELMEQLSEMDLSKLSQMDQNALKQMQDRSEAWANACQQYSGMSEEEKQSLQDYYDSLSESEGTPRRESLVPGQIQRGRGDAEMTYSPYRSPDEVGQDEAISNQDLRNAAISDTIRTTISSQQEKPPEFTGPSMAGSLSTLGAGGEAVWIDRLTPAERKLLRNHFK